MLFYTIYVAIYGVFNGNLNVFYLFILFHSHNVGTLFVYIGYDLSSVSFTYSPANYYFAMSCLPNMFNATFV